MAGKFEIWVLPHNLRIAYERAAELLRRVEFDDLYLNIRRDFEGLIEDLALGVPYENFIEEIRRLGILRETMKPWEKTVKPLLQVLRGIKLKNPALRIICYKSPDFDDLSIRKAEEIAILTFRVNSTGKVDVEEWRRLIYRIIDEASASIEDEAEYILRNYNEDAARERRAICITDFSGKHLLRRIRELRGETTLYYIFLPYYFTPLETLMREAAAMLRRGTVISDERLIKLVRLHAEYIREYILTSADYDEAYMKWLRDRRFKEIS